MENKLEAILKASFNMSNSEYKDYTRLMSLGEWDSLAHMFFITKIEEEYSIDLTGDEIADMQTIGDIKRILTAKGKEI